MADLHDDEYGSDYLDYDTDTGLFDLDFMDFSDIDDYEEPDVPKHDAITTFDEESSSDDTTFNMALLTAVMNDGKAKLDVMEELRNVTFGIRTYLDHQIDIFLACHQHKYISPGEAMLYPVLVSYRSFRGVMWDYHTYEHSYEESLLICLNKNRFHRWNTSVDWKCMKVQWLLSDIELYTSDIRATLEEHATDFAQRGNYRIKKTMFSFWYICHELKRKFNELENPDLTVKRRRE